MMREMDQARRDGLRLLLLGSIVFVLLGVALENSAPSQSVDFRVMYYPARCLIQHQDPYDPSHLMRLYRAEGGDAPTDTDRIRHLVSGYVYLPNAFTFTLPFALLPWGRRTFCGRRSSSRAIYWHRFWCGTRQRSSRLWQPGH
jgi:hypothetical protein